MSSLSDFAPYSVTYGLRDAEFRHLSERDRKKLVRLMARIAEQSYRRGAQQGAYVRAHRAHALRDDLGAWRYSDLDVAPYLDSPAAERSISRLFCECGELRELGFEEPSRQQCKPAWVGYSPARRLRLLKGSSAPANL